MKGIAFAILASGCSSLSSLFFRKNIQEMKSESNGYLVLFFFISFISSILFFPNIWHFQINFVMLSMGISVGILNSTLMLMTSKALKLGPTGMTFAFQIASAVFPGFILFFIFGSDFGYTCTIYQISGMALVLLGLFLGAKKSIVKEMAYLKWLKYAGLCFFIQILALSLIQGRCILFDCPQFFNKPLTLNDDIWFMPGQFGISFLIQSLLFLYKNNKFEKKEIVYGCLGGIVNFASTGLLLLSTQVALPFEKTILFPCFAVSSMVLCNWWSNKLYNEKFHLSVNILCAMGIFISVYHPSYT